MPLITAIFGKQDYSALIWTANHSQIRYGDLITNSSTSCVSVLRSTSSS